MSEIDMLTFTGINYTPIEVEIFIDSIEDLAQLRTDASGKDRVRKIAFFKGLKGAATQWFLGLPLETQRDWELSKKAFLE